MNHSGKVSYLRVIVFSIFGLILGLFIGLLLISQHPESTDNSVFLHIFSLGLAIGGAVIGAVLKVEDNNNQTQSQSILSVIIKIATVIILLAVIYLFINVWVGINNLGII